MTPPRTASRPWGRFATRLNSLAEAPELLGAALGAHLCAGEAVRLLVYGPPWVSLKTEDPATLLAVTDRRWLIVFDGRDGAATVAQSDFADTLLVEISIILLYGRLRVEFVAGGQAQSVQIQFNTVMEKLYEEAIQLLLDHTEGPRVAARTQTRDTQLPLESLPLRFRNALLKFTPPGRPLRDLAHWPACYAGQRRWFQRELAPEAVLALTDRELVLVSDEKTWTWLRVGRDIKFGSVVTYCPLSRLAGFQLGRQPPLGTLNVTLRTAHGLSKLAIDFPAERESDVLGIVEQAGGKTAPAETPECYPYGPPSCF